MAARHAAREWRQGRLAHDFGVTMPETPARPSKPELLRPREMPRRGKGTSLTRRVALIHALAHIEFVAIDLAFDMIGRFGGQFPRAFTDDWMRVGAEEAMHFVLLDRRLREMDSFYGQLPAHEGLWGAAIDTPTMCRRGSSTSRWYSKREVWLLLSQRLSGASIQVTITLRQF